MCKICQAPAPPFDVVDFNKFCDLNDCYGFDLSAVPVAYHRCSSCGFLFTALCDTWTGADFRELIYNDDYILVDGDYPKARPELFARIMSERVAAFREDRLLDYGSGAGVYVERMREAGFTRIEGYDPISSPTRPAGRFDVVTCFEVIEHTPDPHATLAEMAGFLAPRGCILLTQQLQPPNINELRCSWWYAAPRNGHVSLYSEKAFFLLARAHGLDFYRGEDFHAFAFDPLSDKVRDLLAIHTVRMQHADQVFAPPAPLSAVNAGGGTFRENWRRQVARVPGAVRAKRASFAAARRVKAVCTQFLAGGGA